MKFEILNNNLKCYQLFAKKYLQKEKLYKFFSKDKIANRKETGIENRTEREQNRNGYGTKKERKWNGNG